MEQKKELNLWIEIDDWINENQQRNTNKLQQVYMKTTSYFGAKIPQAYSNALNDFFTTAFFHSQSLLQNSKHFGEKKNDILKRAQILRTDIRTINDLKNLPIRQLNFLAEQEISKALIISSVQGGMSGTGTKFALLCDIPALFLINLKTVQEIAMCYGFDVSIPLEMECSLKILQGALLPSPVKYETWRSLMNDTLMHDEEDVFANWQNDFKMENFYQTILIQFSKLYLINLLKNRVVGGVPLLGMTVGAKWNETITKNVLDYTKLFYQYRILSKRIKKEPTV